MEQSSRRERLLQILKQLDFEDINEEKFYTEFDSIYNSNNRNSENSGDSIVVSQEDLENGLESSNEYYFIIYDPTEETEGDYERIRSQLIEKIQKLTVVEMQRILLVELFDTIKKRAETNKKNRVLELRKLVQDNINRRKQKGKILLSNIEYSSFVVPKEISTKTKFEIKIKDRVRSLEQSYSLEKKEYKSKLNSYVFTAELDSLMDLYNSFGDQLLQKMFVLEE